VFTPATICIYQDGVLALNASAIFAYGPVSNWTRSNCYLFKSNWADGYPTGQLSSFQLYDYALNSSQVSELSSAPSTSGCPACSCIVPQLDVGLQTINCPTGSFIKHNQYCTVRVLYGYIIKSGGTRILCKSGVMLNLPSAQSLSTLSCDTNLTRSTDQAHFILPSAIPITVLSKSNYNLTLLYNYTIYTDEIISSFISIIPQSTVGLAGVGLNMSFSTGISQSLFYFSSNANRSITIPYYSTSSAQTINVLFTPASLHSCPLRYIDDGHIRLIGDNSTQFLNTNLNLNISLTQTITISYWVKRTITGPSIKTIQMAYGNSSDISHSLLVCGHINDHLFFSTLSNDLLSPLTYMDTDIWIHVIFTFDMNSHIRLIYRNSELIAKDFSTIQLDSTDEPATMSIGCWNGQYCTTGSIDELRVYTRILTMDEVGNAFHNNIFNNLNSLVLYLPFNENVGTMIYDQSGSSVPPSSFTLTNLTTLSTSIWILPNQPTGQGHYIFNGASTSTLIRPNMNIATIYGFTMCMWIKRARGNIQEYVFGYGNVFSNGQYVSGGFRSSNQYFFSLTNSSSDLVSSSTFSDVNIWIHVCMRLSSTINGNVLTRYIDRNAITIATDINSTTTINITRGSLIINGYSQYADWYNITDNMLGSMDEICIWQSFLTQTQITMNYNNNILFNIDSLQLFLSSCDSFNGDMIYDNSGKSNHMRMRSSNAVQCDCAIGQKKKQRKKKKHTYTHNTTQQNRERK
jgi:hypothetical protein